MPTLLICSLFSLGFSLSLWHMKVSFPLSSTSAYGRHKIKPVAEGGRWTGKFTVRGVPSSVKKPHCVEYQCLLIFSSARHLCHFLCNNHLSPLCFFIVHPPSTPFLSPHPCSSPVILSLSLSLSPLCCGFPSIQVHIVHTSGVSTCRPAPAASLLGGYGGNRWDGWLTRLGEALPCRFERQKHTLGGCPLTNIAPPRHAHSNNVEVPCFDVFPLFSCTNTVLKCRFTHKILELEFTYNSRRIPHLLNIR